MDPRKVWSLKETMRILVVQFHICLQIINSPIAGMCTEADGSIITTVEECEKACLTLDINRFVIGNWPDSPGCFYFLGNKNCHWNLNTDVKWGAKDHRAVCGPKE